MSNYFSSLRRFSKTAERFHEAGGADGLDIRCAEARLIKANVNFNFWLDEDPSDSLTRDPVDNQDVTVPVPNGAHDIEEAWFLGFAEIDSTWQFAVRKVFEFTVADDVDVDSSFIFIAPDRCRMHLSVTPLAQASLTIQAAAARKLKTFIDAFEAALNKVTPAEAQGDSRG
jgi:hypothetical protein